MIGDLMDNSGYPLDMLRHVVDHEHGNFVYSDCYQMAELKEFADGFDILRYVNDDMVVDYNHPRACPRCGRTPDSIPNDFDPCIGCVDGLQAACCGHGIDDPYVFTKTGQRMSVEGVWTALKTWVHVKNIPLKTPEFRPMIMGLTRDDSEIIVFDKDPNTSKLLIGTLRPVFWSTWKGSCPRYSKNDETDWKPNFASVLAEWNKICDVLNIDPGDNLPFIPDVVTAQHLTDIAKQVFDLKLDRMYTSTVINDIVPFSVSAEKDPVWTAPMEYLPFYLCAWVDSRIPLRDLSIHIKQSIDKFLREQLH